MPEPISWQECHLEENHWLRVCFGPLEVIVLNRFDEWRISARARGSEPELAKHGRFEALPDELTWQRWSCAGEDHRVQLRPAFPALPVIAKPRHPFTIGPKSSVLFYIGVPASIEVRTSCNGEMRSLLSIPTEALSKTWHGNRSVGSACYALKTRARRSLDDGDWVAHDIACAVDVKNERSEPFPFETLFLDTGHLGIFEENGRLWSNALRIRVDEDARATNNDVTYAPRPLEPAAEATELTPPPDGRARRSKLRAAFSSFIDAIH